MPLWTPDSRTTRVDELLAKAPILPVLAIENIDDAVPLARALVEAGLPVLEITLRSAVAIEAIRRIATQVPGAVVGAGTVLDASALRAVTDAGALFAIAPGATEALYAAAAESEIPFLPAIATASELMRLEHGHRRFKFFPAASSGGVDTLRAFSSPFAQVRFCPTGGINALSAPSYLALPNVITVGGSWMVPRTALEAQDWTTIDRLSRICVKLAKRP